MKRYKSLIQELAERYPEDGDRFSRRRLSRERKPTSKTPTRGGGLLGLIGRVVGNPLIGAGAAMHRAIMPAAYKHGYQPIDSYISGMKRDPTRPRRVYIQSEKDDE